MGSHGYLMTMTEKFDRIVGYAICGFNEQILFTASDTESPKSGGLQY